MTTVAGVGCLRMRPVSLAYSRGLATIALVVVLGVGAAACHSASSSDAARPATDVATTQSDPGAEVMAAAVSRLVTRDHTFGQGSHRFTEYLIQSRIDPAAGDPMGSAESATRRLTGVERSRIEFVVAPLGPVRFIDDPDDWRTENLEPTIEGSVIVGVGEPRITGGTALVPVSLWCGGLCGTWLTYRLTWADGVWRVKGTKGPGAVS